MNISKKDLSKLIEKAAKEMVDTVVKDAVEKAIKETLEKVGHRVDPTPPSPTETDSNTEDERIRLEVAKRPGGKNPNLSPQEQKQVDDPENARMHLPVPEISQILDKEEINYAEIEDDWGASRGISPTGWFVVVGLIICCVGGWAIYESSQAHNTQAETIIDQTQLKVNKAKDDAETRMVLASMQDCVREYLAAGSVQVITDHVRHPERVGPFIESYYKSHKRWRRKFLRFELIRSVSMGNRSFVIVIAKTQSGASRKLLLEQIEDGSFRVDWESDVVYQPVPWPDYLRTRPLAAADMRVLVKEDHFYGFAFRDSDKYLCYRLTALGSDDYLFGYVERGSKVAEEIEHLLHGGKVPPPTDDNNEVTEATEIGEELGLGDPVLTESALNRQMQTDAVSAKSFIPSQKPQPMILRIRFLRDDPSMRCVKIDALLAKRWMYENSPEPPAVKSPDPEPLAVVAPTAPIPAKPATPAKVAPPLAQNTPSTPKAVSPPNLPPKTVSVDPPQKKPEAPTPPSSPAAKPKTDPTPEVVSKPKTDPTPEVASKPMPKPAPKTTEPTPEKTPEAIPEPAPTLRDSGRVHIVKRGDSLSRIAQRYKVPLEDVLKINGIKNANKISLGQKIKIPAK